MYKTLILLLENFYVAFLNKQFMRYFTFHIKMYEFC